MTASLRTFSAVVALMSFLGPPASAQEISGAFNMGTLTNTMSMGATIKSECARAVRMGQTVSRNTPWCATDNAASRKIFARPAGSASVSLQYAASPVFQKQVVTDFLERVGMADSKDAGILRSQLSQHDYHAIFDSVVRPYGLAGNDAASSMAAYLILGWMIVHDGREPPAGAARAVRAQVAASLSAGGLSAPATRARLGEEFKILFVTVHAGWQSARKDGKLDRYATGVAELFRNDDGLDLRTARLTRLGLIAG